MVIPPDTPAAFPECAWPGFSPVNDLRFLSGIGEELADTILELNRFLGKTDITARPSAPEESGSG